MFFSVGVTEVVWREFELKKLCVLLFHYRPSSTLTVLLSARDCRLRSCIKSFWGGRWCRLLLLLSLTNIFDPQCSLPILRLITFFLICSWHVKKTNFHTWAPWWKRWRSQFKTVELISLNYWSDNVMLKLMWCDRPCHIRDVWWAELTVSLCGRESAEEKEEQTVSILLTVSCLFVSAGLKPAGDSNTLQVNKSLPVITHSAAADCFLFLWLSF